MNSKLLKLKRFEMDFFQSDIARMLGVTEKTYNLKENGVNEFKRDEIEKLKNILKLSVEEVDAIFFKSEITNTQSKEA